MTPIIRRRFVLALAFTFSLATVYCGLLSFESYAQTTSGTQGATLQAPGKKKAATITAPAPAATDSAPSTPPPGKDGMEGDTIDFSDHTGVGTCRNWVYTRGDTVISGTTAKWNRKADTLDTDDPVVMNDTKHHLTADKAHVDHAEKNPSLRLVILTGHAVMVLKPETPPAPTDVSPAPVDAPGTSVPGKLKVVSIVSQQPGASPQIRAKDAPPPADAKKTETGPPAEDKDRQDAKAQQKHGGTVTCDRIEYKTAKKFATLTGHVVFKQRFVDNDGKQIERTLTCEHAEDDGKANVLHLFKPVHFEDNDGETGDSVGDAYVGTKEGEETLRMAGHTHMTFTSPDEDEDGDDSKGTNPKDTKHNTDKGANKASQ